MIKPTIGRIVWFWRTDSEEGQAEPGIVCYVLHDRSVNLAVFDDTGTSREERCVTLHQEGDPAPAGRHASWMLYQVGQAKETP